MVIRFISDSFLISQRSEVYNYLKLWHISLFYQHVRERLREGILKEVFVEICSKIHRKDTVIIFAGGGESLLFSGDSGLFFLTDEKQQIPVGHSKKYYRPHFYPSRE
ncbi:hypothetical protein DW083_17940 [Parabacteroides sp. AF48-14]|nr:hypothetical protein DW083_17940 [Parabacteroides sp. AF48-14]